MFLLTNILRGVYIKRLRIIKFSNYLSFKKYTINNEIPFLRNLDFQVALILFLHRII